MKLRVELAAASNQLRLNIKQFARVKDARSCVRKDFSILQNLLLERIKVHSDGVRRSSIFACDVDTR